MKRVGRPVNDVFLEFMLEMKKHTQNEPIKETFDSFLDYESPRGKWYSSYTYYDYIVKITDIEEYTKQKFKES